MTFPHVSAAPAGGGNVIAKMKTADTSRNNTTSLVDDPDLAGFPVEAGELYIIEAHLMAVAFSATPDFKFRFFGGTSNATFGSMYEVEGFAIAGNTLLSGNNEIVQLVSGVANNLKLTLAWEPTVSTDLALQWAQNISNASATILGLGSWMKVTKV